MKYIIDLIEDVREQIGNHGEYTVKAGLLKTDENDEKKLIYSGEATLSTFHIDEIRKELIFEIDASESSLTISDLIPPLLILDMDAMMFALKIDVNAQYKNMEIVGFGKNDEQKAYILFIKI
ncbi:MAG: hypothetical protein GQ531_05780 [Sulfurovum sp.]|nr:hypothetical protein [Sulfurovum sp.]